MTKQGWLIASLLGGLQRGAGRPRAGLNVIYVIY